MKKVIISILIISLAFFSVNVFAHEHDDDDDDHEQIGFSGMIQTGGLWESTTSQLEVNDDDKRIQTLDKEADRFDELEPGILFDLKYTYPSRTAIYLNTPYEDEFGLSLGVSQGLPDGSQVGISTFYSLFEEAWRNPYMTGVSRTETDVTKIGCGLTYDRILRTSLSLGYKYRKVDVDQDLIGELFSDLKRDGDIHSIAFDYGFRLGSGHLLKPQFQYTLAETDGKSNSYNGFEIGLDYMKMFKNSMIQLSVSGESETYDRLHPIFNKKRKDKKYEATAIYSWQNPFGFQKLFCNFVIEGGFTDSNIDFFKSEDLFIFIGTGYNF